MISLKNINLILNDTTVLDDVSFSLAAHEVVALLGQNGAGKSTLLKVIHGDMAPTRGKIERGAEVIGYLPQEFSLQASTIGDCFSTVIPEWRISLALERVGLESSRLDAATSTLSGGQKTRLGLAQLLATEPEPTVLLLDEPTNNLDQDGIEWLVNFIRSYHGSVLLVSHHRSFVNAVAHRVVELDHGHTALYGGNYDFYRSQKQAEEESAWRHYKETADERRRIEAMVRVAKDKARVGVKNKKAPDNDKFAKGFFNNRVQGKASARAKSLESRLRHMEPVERPELPSAYRLTVSVAQSDAKLLELRQVTKAYDHGPVLRAVSLQLRGQERIAIHGANGSGKTTLLKIAAGLEQPNDGLCRYGAATRLSYISQEAEDLVMNRSALEQLQENSHTVSELYRIASLLDLAYEDLHRPVNQLSRGQRSKLLFARALLRQTNVLLLDEPTNHLDIPTRERIERSLQAYSGALLVVSHDSYFLKQLGLTGEYCLKQGTLIAL